MRPPSALRRLRRRAGFPAVRARPGDGRGAAKVRAGDTWTYRQVDDYTGIDRGVFRVEVTGTGGNDIQARLNLPGGGVTAETYDSQWGWKTVSNRGWDWLSRLAFGSATVEFRPPFDSMPFPLHVGKSWRDSGVAINPATGGQIAIQVASEARCWEHITVPGGRVHRAAHRAHRRTYRTSPGTSRRRRCAWSTGISPQ